MSGPCPSHCSFSACHILRSRKVWHQTDACLAHDTLYHADGAQVIGRVGIARDVGILQEQGDVGIVHTAKHDGYFVRQRMPACHQRIGSLVVEHGY